MAHTDTDISTIEACIRQDRKAQEKLYKDYYRAMVSLCLRYTKNDADAMEVLNTGFLKVFNNIHRYEPAQASLYTWIRTVIINSCLDHIKSKQRRQPVKELSEAIEVDIPAEAILKLSASEIMDLVRRLPPATQAVFNLYVMEGYSHKETASLLGISEGTSKWHLSEARKALKELVKKEIMIS